MNTKIRPVHCDGFLYVLMAVCMAAVDYITSDGASAFVSKEVQFWVKGCGEVVGAAALALKAYRSTSYADSVQGAPAVPPPVKPEPTPVVPDAPKV
jgi:hypothetical protein